MLLQLISSVKRIFDSEFYTQNTTSAAFQMENHNADTVCFNSNRGRMQICPVQAANQDGSVENSRVALCLRQQLSVMQAEAIMSRQARSWWWIVYGVCLWLWCERCIAEPSAGYKWYCDLCTFRARSSLDVAQPLQQWSFISPEQWLHPVDILQSNSRHCKWYCIIHL